MTTQEIFDKVAVHLLTQNEKSTETMRHIEPTSPSTINCRYRGAEGRMCAIGCLIPDHKYDPRIEGGSVDSHRVLEVLYDIGIQEHSIFLIRLQHIHDGIEVIEWRNKLKQVAQQYSLKSDCLDKDYDKATNI